MRNFWLSLLLLAGLSFANNADNKNISLASGFGGYVFGEGYVTAGFDVGGWLHDSYIESDSFLFFLRAKTHFNKNSFSAYVNPSFVYAIDCVFLLATGPEVGVTKSKFDYGWSARVDFTMLEFNIAKYSKADWKLSLSVFITKALLMFSAKEAPSH